MTSLIILHIGIHGNAMNIKYTSAETILKIREKGLGIQYQNKGLLEGNKNKSLLEGIWPGVQLAWHNIEWLVRDKLMLLMTGKHPSRTDKHQRAVLSHSLGRKRGHSQDTHDDKSSKQATL